MDGDLDRARLLGINKLFEGALTNVGRMIAFDQGWYAHRRVFQIWLIASVLAICSIGAIVLLLSARQASLSTRVALSATIMLLALEHDPEKCEAIFRKDHAQTTT